MKICITWITTLVNWSREMCFCLLFLLDTASVMTARKDLSFFVLIDRRWPTSRVSSVGRDKLWSQLGNLHIRRLIQLGSQIGFVEESQWSFMKAITRDYLFIFNDRFRVGLVLLARCGERIRCNGQVMVQMWYSEASRARPNGFVLASSQPYHVMIWISIKAKQQKCNVRRSSAS